LASENRGLNSSATILGAEHFSKTLRSKKTSRFYALYSQSMSEFHQALSPASSAASNDSLHFLRLPGELRNHIYALALTLPDKTIQYVTKSVVQPTNEVESGISNDPQTLATTTQKSKTGEPVYHFKNQLQHVCKELRQETHWLELRLNPTIIFRSEGKNVSATKQFLQFFDMIPANKRTWIRTVEVYSGTKASHWDKENKKFHLLMDSNQTLRSLADLCRYNPFVTVKYRLVPLDCRLMAKGMDRFELCFFIHLVTRYLAVIRDDTSRELWPEPFAHILAADIERFINEQNLTRQDVAHLKVFNLRFFPMDYPLPEKMFVESKTFYRDVAHTQSIIPMWEQAVRRWLAEGI
jgi:hypothetical protein